AAAEPLVDDPRWHVPGPEAGDPDLFADLPVGLVEAGLELSERNLDGQLDPGRAEPLDIGLHGGVTPWSPAIRPPPSRGRGGAGRRGFGRLRRPSLWQADPMAGHHRPGCLGRPGPATPARVSRSVRLVLHRQVGALGGRLL